MNRLRKNQIITAIEPALQANGYYCLDVDWNAAEKALGIYVDRKDGVAMSVEDCVCVNKIIGEDQEMLSAIPDDGFLEVSSPGDDRPLRTLEDFHAAVGKKVSIELEERVAERKSGRGILLNCNPEKTLTIETSRGPWSFAVAQVNRARLAEKTANS